mgnify:FL=1
MKNNKIIFCINVDNHIDLITNSSSELFVLSGKTKETVTEMIESIYPDFRNEYEEPKNISELTADELDQLMIYMCSARMWPARKGDMPVPAGFTFDELYEKDGDEPAWNGHWQYRLRNNVKSPSHKFDRSFVTEDNREDIIRKLSPDTNMWMLYSIDENPNYDYQEKLEGISTRYHLG